MPLADLNIKICAMPLVAFVASPPASRRMLAHRHSSRCVHDLVAACRLCRNVRHAAGAL